MIAAPFTDSGQAELACPEALLDKFIHVTGLGWLKYDGRAWREVPDKVPLDHLRRWTLARLTADPTEYKNWAKRLDAPKLRNVLTLAAGMAGISVEPEQLDANPDVLNCRNGVVYLPTGDLTPHNPSLYLTRCTNVDYVPAALHEDWTAALRAIPVEVQSWLQARYGQAITGHMCPDDRVLIQQGGGSNGKSTVLAGVAAALGDFYFQASDKILMGGQNAGHTTDFFDLRGTRFVAVEETPEAGRLDVVRLKKVAGTERITARKLYADNVSFPASHTLVVNTNYPPVVGETDEGTWRRLLLVAFPYTFVRHPAGEMEIAGDPGLRDRLRSPDQRRAVLAWLVEGAVRWYEHGRTFDPAPARVVEDTDAWRFHTDLIGTFWSDHLDPDPTSYIYAGDLIWFFNQFMRQHGNSPLAESTFVRRFENHKETRGHLVARRRVRQQSRDFTVSRPHGALDPFSRLPGLPTGQVWAWTGVAFRHATLDGSDLRFYGGESAES